jgi:uncharacterized protein DUF2786
MRDCADAEPPGAGGRGSSASRIREALWAAAGIHRDRPGCSQADAEVLVATDFERVAAEAEQQLRWLIGLAWQRGWQPRELMRYVRHRNRQLGPVMSALVVADRDRHDPRAVHPDWSAQVDALDAGDVPEAGWLLEVVEEETAELREQLTLLVAAMALLSAVPSLSTVLPRPGTDPSTWHRLEYHRAAADNPVLTKVRGLLAQAESTPYEAEAEAFTAKAQELMARYSIDEALVWSRSGQSDRPVTVRLPIDDPYAGQKAQLLHVVANHSRCKAVLHPGLGLVSVVGFASDLAACELLFTSLLVQSQAAMRAEAANSPSGSHTRGRAFRSAFLFAYACRIDKRLAEVNATVEAEAADSAAAIGDGSALLPVLVARADAIDDEIAATFGPLTKTSARRSYDALGWDRGVLAADRAQLRPDLPAAGA